jgi:hypothetical protein
MWCMCWKCILKCYWKFFLLLLIIPILSHGNNPLDLHILITGVWFSEFWGGFMIFISWCYSQHYIVLHGKGDFAVPLRILVSCLEKWGNYLHMYHNHLSCIKAEFYPCGIEKGVYDRKWEILITFFWLREKGNHVERGLWEALGNLEQTWATSKQGIWDLIPTLCYNKKELKSKFFPRISK